MSADGIIAFKRLCSTLCSYLLPGTWASAQLAVGRHTDARIPYCSLELTNGVPAQDCTIEVYVGTETTQFHDALPRIIPSIPMGQLSSLSLQIPDAVVRHHADRLCSALSEARAVTKLIVTGDLLCACICVRLCIPDDSHRTSGRSATDALESDQTAGPTRAWSLFPSLTALTLDGVELGQNLDACVISPGIWPMEGFAGEKTPYGALCHALSMRRDSARLTELLVTVIGGQPVSQEQARRLRELVDGTVRFEEHSNTLRVPTSRTLPSLGQEKDIDGDGVYSDDNLESS